MKGAHDAAIGNGYWDRSGLGSGGEEWSCQRADQRDPATGFRRAAGRNVSHWAFDAHRGAGGRSTPGSEGYELHAAPDRVTIVAPRPAGLFYGIQTLRQLLPAAIFSKTKVDDVAWDVPCVKITDSPRFAWRGLLLDPARHFTAKADLLAFIDTMTLHKFNSLQLHLTDDQGWRIEIKKYPKLTEIGAWRRETLVGHAGRPPYRFDGKRHGGFYSQDDVREIVRYAAERYIHIGGDEAVKDQWTASEEIQAMIRDEDLKDEAELQSWFIEQMDAFLTRHVLGLQGQLWGEYIATPDHLEYMAYPRAAAIAEIGWSPEEAKDYDSFVARLRPHLERLKALGVNFCPLD